MDGLYRTIRDHPSTLSIKLLYHIVVAVVYVLIHSMVMFMELVSLNVAINSKSSALLTLLISNNFVELKVPFANVCACLCAIACESVCLRVYILCRAYRYVCMNKCAPQPV